MVHFTKFQFLITLHLLGTHVFCKSQTIMHVKSSEELQKAINIAKPGDTIILGPTTFTGKFVCVAKSTSHLPITIRGTNHQTKVIGNGHGTAFTIIGNNWVLESLPISGYDVGILVKGIGNKLSGLVVQSVNKAIEIQGSKTTVRGCVLESINDSGIDIKASNVVLMGNTLQNSGTSITIHHGTCCGTINGNTLEGGMMVHGNDYSFMGNVVEGSTVVTGCRNSFTGQVSSSPSFTLKCENNFMGGGNVFY